MNEEYDSLISETFCGNIGEGIFVEHHFKVLARIILFVVIVIISYSGNGIRTNNLLHNR